MHRTHLSLLTWAQAIYRIVAFSKGNSDSKLSEMLGISYPSAWYLGHRVRAMMAEANPLLAGVVELDEMYAGAPSRKRAKSSRASEECQTPPANPKGRGTKRSLLRIAAERGGKVAARVIPTHGKAPIAEALEGKLAPDAVVMTDGRPAYKPLGTERTHLYVIHSDREYARIDAATGHRGHVNRVESFNSFLRRAVLGVWHQIRAKHLGRYAAETAFRWNRKTQSTVARMAERVRDGEGRLLCYVLLTAKTTA